METEPLYEYELARTLSLLDITAIGVGAMIGAGIFVLTGVAAGVAGPAIILAFIINGVITLLTALSYAELGSAMPQAGGGYLWVRESMSGPTGFVAGWMSWFGHIIAGSLYALGFGAYFTLTLQSMGISFFGLGLELSIKLLAVIIIVIFVAINFKGVSETGKAGVIVTFAKVIILAIFIGAGLWAMYNKPDYGISNFTPFIPNGIGSIFIACGLTFIAFEGYEIIAQAGEEVRNPRKNVPRATILAILIVIPIYCLVAYVSLGALTVESGTTWEFLGSFGELGLVEAARQFMPAGLLLLATGGLLSTMSALNATTYSSTRVSFAMARDNFLPGKLAAIHRKNRTPHLALLCSGIIMIAMAVSIPLQDVASASSIMFFLLFMLVNIAVILIRRSIGDKLDYGFRMPSIRKIPFIPIIAIVANIGLAAFLFQYSPTAWYVTVLWVLLGMGVYLAYSRRNYVKTEQWKKYAYLKKDSKGQ
jgi:amino acid transporter